MLNNSLTVKDFLVGNSTLDSYFQGLNLYSDQVDKYTAYNPHLLSPGQYSLIANTNPQFPYILSQWLSTVGANDTSVILSTRENLSERSERQSEQVKFRTYDLLYSQLQYSNLEKQTVILTAREGNSVWLRNSEGSIINESIFRFNVYWDNQNKVARYAYKGADGQEVPGMTDLRHGVELYHFRDPVNCTYPVAPSRLDSAFIYLLLENKALRANVNLFAHGMIGTLILKFNEKLIPEMQKANLAASNQQKDPHWFNILMTKVNDMLAGVSRSNRIASIAGLEDVLEPGKSNKDSQFMELLKLLVPERLAWAYGLTLADFGAGGSTTYNNVATFNDALYDKVGRSLEQALDHARNSWLLPQYGVPISSKFYVQYNQPEDPNKLNEAKQALEDWKNNTITLNEYRDIRGREPLANGNQLMNEYLNSTRAAVQGQIVDVSTQDPENTDSNFFQKAIQYKENIVERSLKTSEKKNLKSAGKQPSQNKSKTTYSDLKS